MSDVTVDVPAESKPEKKQAVWRVEWHSQGFQLLRRKGQDWTHYGFYKYKSAAIEAMDQIIFEEKKEAAAQAERQPLEFDADGIDIV